MKSRKLNAVGDRGVEVSKKMSPGGKGEGRKRRAQKFRDAWEGENSNHGGAWRTPPSLRLPGVPEAGGREHPGSQPHCRGLLRTWRVGHLWHCHKLLDSKAFQRPGPLGIGVELDTQWGHISVQQCV